MTIFDAVRKKKKIVLEKLTVQDYAAEVERPVTPFAKIQIYE